MCDTFLFPFRNEENDKRDNKGGGDTYASTEWRATMRHHHSTIVYYMYMHSFCLCHEHWTYHFISQFPLCKYFPRQFVIVEKFNLSVNTVHLCHCIFNSGYGFFPISLSLHFLIFKSFYMLRWWRNLICSWSSWNRKHRNHFAMFVVRY